MTDLTSKAALVTGGSMGLGVAEAYLTADYFTLRRQVPDWARR